LHRHRRRYGNGGSHAETDDAETDDAETDDAETDDVTEEVTEEGGKSGQAVY
jgi:hypothetical protein